jgi:flagellar basal-body rod protein FlgB
MSDLRITSMAHDLMAHAAARQSHVARNVANADTPGYRATDLPSFTETLDRGAGLKATRPGHVGWGEKDGSVRPVERAAEAAPNGNTVSLETEMMHAAELKQQNDMALSVYSSVRDIVRTSLGRNR